jgi:hypothetical protein
MRFRTVIVLGGKTATGMRVPPDVVASLGSSRRPAVCVTINGYTYRSTVAVMGGEFMLPVAAEVREQAHIAAGDEVEVDIELDTEPRVVSVPPDFVAALAADPEIQRRFDGLSYTRRRELVFVVEDAKTDDTRRRRIARAIEEIRQAPDRR